MRVFNYQNLTLCQSARFDGLFEGREMKERAYGHAHDFIRSKTFREVLSAHHKETGLCGYLLLFAHGEVNGNGNWFFHDGERRLLMQNWIDRNDGNCLAMLLSCCNSRDYEVSSKKSIIIHPACDIELMRPSNLRIFVPGEGYLDKYRQRREYIESHC